MGLGSAAVASLALRETVVVVGGMGWDKASVRLGAQVLRKGESCCKDGKCMDTHPYEECRRERLPKCTIRYALEAAAPPKRRCTRGRPRKPGMSRLLAVVKLGVKVSKSTTNEQMSRQQGLASTSQDPRIDDGIGDARDSS